VGRPLLVGGLKSGPTRPATGPLTVNVHSKPKKNISTHDLLMMNSHNTLAGRIIYPKFLLYDKASPRWCFRHNLRADSTWDIIYRWRKGAGTTA